MIYRDSMRTSNNKEYANYLTIASDGCVFIGKNPLEEKYEKALKLLERIGFTEEDIENVEV